MLLNRTLVLPEAMNCRITIIIIIMIMIIIMISIIAYCILFYSIILYYINYMILGDELPA